MNFPFVKSGHRSELNKLIFYSAETVVHVMYLVKFARIPVETEQSVVPRPGSRALSSSLEEGFARLAAP